MLFFRMDCTIQSLTSHNIEVLPSAHHSSASCAIGILALRSIIYISWNILLIQAYIQLLKETIDNSNKSILIQRLVYVVTQLKMLLAINIDHIAVFSFVYTFGNGIDNEFQKREIIQCMVKILVLYFLYNVGSCTEMFMKALVLYKCVCWIFPEIYLNIGYNGTAQGLYRFAFHF